MHLVKLNSFGCKQCCTGEAIVAQLFGTYDREQEVFRVLFGHLQCAAGTSTALKNAFAVMQLRLQRVMHPWSWMDSCDSTAL